MFEPITIPYNAKMLFNVVTLKEGYTLEDAELVMGEMCNVVKNTYANDGFIAGQVFKYSGFVSEEGTLGEPDEKRQNCAVAKDNIAIITYWNSFEQHERSHADSIFKEKFQALAAMCDETFEIGYDLLWQGIPE